VPSTRPPVSPEPRPRPARPEVTVPVVLAVLVGTFCLGLALGQATPAPDAARPPATGTAQPTTVAIPALGVRAAVIPVGRTADGAIGAPDADPVRAAGWFTGGPYPGAVGTAVIVGHIDTETRPAVFHRLSRLRPGQVVEVVRRDRRTVTFRVDSVERFPKTAFPVERIFGAADRPRLALVTCGGRWVGGELGYAENVIAFASLVTPHQDRVGDS
jgi:hypothetical protein